MEENREYMIPDIMAHREKLGWKPRYNPVDFGCKLAKEIQWAGELGIKFDLLKGKKYAPKYPFEVRVLDSIEMNEINRRIELAKNLEQYAVKLGFDDFVLRLGQIQWTEELERKMDGLKGEKYAPKYIFEVKTLNKMRGEEINRKMYLVDELENEYGEKITKFKDFKDVERISLQTKFRREIYDTLAKGRE